jgi:uncharacterized NAD-dependent epimerase/dehydratase family protein
VRVDYAAGAVEKAVLQVAEGAGEESLVFVEGQGSFCHPGSTATLPLMRGSQADSLLLVHRAGQRSIRNFPEIALPPLPELITVVEALARLARPQGQPLARVKAIALNTALLDEGEAAAAIAQTTDETGCCCADPVRGGADRLLEALLS